MPVLTLFALLFSISATYSAAPSPLSPDAPWGAPPGTLQSLSSAAGQPWLASSATWGLTVPATVPGDLVTDLQRAGVIGDPFFELGWLNTTTPGFQGAPLWDVGAWNFSAGFDLAVPAGAAAYLIFDGVKMAADVYLNGVAIGAVADQFLRYAFPLPAGLLRPRGNELAVVFATSRDPRNAEGRFSGASGGWDWGEFGAPPPPRPHTRALTPYPERRTHRTAKKGPYTNTNTGGRQVGGG
jgi:hypothetical protein